MIEYPDVASGASAIIPLNGFEQVTSLPTITITFDYPLSTVAVLTFESPTGSTLNDLFRCTCEGYKRIYAAEEDPASEGPYGIWGHCSDLYLEGIREVAPGRFELDVCFVDPWQTRHG